MSPTSIKLDGEDAENAYALVDPADWSVKLVRIYDVDFSTTKSHTYEIDVPAADNGVLEYINYSFSSSSQCSWTRPSI